jgi:hypothetical protein
MLRYRLKIFLLSLGVVAGYGSALAHHFYGHAWHQRDFCAQHEQPGEAAWQSKNSGKPVH